MRKLLRIFIIFILVSIIIFLSALSSVGVYETINNFEKGIDIIFPSIVLLSVAFILIIFYIVATINFIKRKSRRLVLKLIFTPTISLAVLAGLLFLFFIPVKIRVGSVADGKYKENQTVIGERFTYLFKDPKIADVVTFKNLRTSRIGQIYGIKKEDATIIYSVKHDAGEDSSLTKDRIISRIYWGLPFKKETELSKESLEEKYEAPRCDPENKVFFYRTGLQTNNRAGIWAYDFSDDSETQLISFKEMSNIIDNLTRDTAYSTPVISPDRSKIIFYLKSGDDTYNLWFYDLTNGKKEKLLKNKTLLYEYIQSPIWSNESNLIYLTFYENGFNKLFSLDLNGNIKKLANSYDGQIFWPKIINKSLLIFYPSLPKVNEIGILDLKTDKVDIIKTPTSAYGSEISNFQENFLIKSSTNISSSGTFDDTNIYGLEKLDLRNLNVEKFPIPKEIIFTPETKRIEPLVVCGKWALLGTIVKGVDIGEKRGTDFYRYNLETNFTEPFKINGEFKYSSLDCATDGSSSFYTLMRDNRFVFFDLANPSNNKDYSLNEITNAVLNDSCLYQESFYAEDYLSDSSIYLDLVPGQTCQSFDEKTGIYRISLDKKNIIKISNPKNYNEQDFLLKR